MDSFSHSGRSDQSASSYNVFNPPNFSGRNRNRYAALYWYGKQYPVIPVAPGTKRPAVGWDAWLENLSAGAVDDYWSKHPDHEVGFICGDNYIVFDADSATAVSALEQSEEEFGVKPSLIVKTKRGAHHYFRKDPTVHGKTGCVKVGPNPDDRIDVKTGRTMVVLPPSKDKEIVHLDGECDHISSLSIAPLKFIESFMPNFGRVEAVSPDRPMCQGKAVSEATYKVIAACLSRLDSDMARSDWFKVAAAMFNATGGSEAGYSMFDMWSCLGDKYKGQRETRNIWRYFKPGYSNPVTIATLIRMVVDAGYIWDEILHDAEPFEIELMDAA